jgi:NADH:ubiquinone oxidoreductase subunit 5 (subunit L)/multisubunit Na+/H+ antiporter MnhA subunit
MGFPFLTGFYSKDLILEFAYSRFIIDSNFIYFLGLTSAICTAIYSIRLLYYVFFYKKFGNGPRVFYHLICSFEIEAS